MGIAHGEKCSAVIPSIIYGNHPLRFPDHVAVSLHEAGGGIFLAYYLDSITSLQQCMELLVPSFQAASIGNDCFQE